MRGRIEQHLVLVLAVEIDEAAAQIAQCGAGGEGAVDRGAAAALRRDFATDDHLAAVRGIEDRLDAGAVLTGTDEFGRGTPPDQQADRPDEDGLAGAGFARQHVEARFEIEFQAVDDGKVPDAQES